MSGICSKCSQSCIFKEPKNNKELFGYPCDFCKNILCKTCTGFSTAEIRTLIQSTRVIPYICKDCVPGIMSALTLQDRVSALEDSLNQIKANNTSSNTQKPEVFDRQMKNLTEDVKSMKTNFLTTLEDIKEDLNIIKGSAVMSTSNNATDAYNGPSPEEEIIFELEDRQKRAKNVMIFNVPEGKDKEQVKSLLAELCDLPPEVLHVSRVGKYNANQARAIRVVLNSPEDAKNVLKNGFKLKGKKIFVTPDLTSKQRDERMRVSHEPKNRQRKGENIYYKY